MREPRRRGEGALARLFPERIVTIETTGAHHVARLTPRMQAAALAVSMALGGWTVAATGMVALSALDSAAGRVETETALLTRAERLERDAADASARAAQSEARAEAALAALEGGHESARSTIVALRSAQARAAALRADVERAEAERARLAGALAEAEADRAASERALATAAAQRDDLADTLQRIAAALDATAAARDDAVAAAREVEGALGAMAADAEAAEDRRRALLAQVEAAAEMTLGSLEAMLAETGVDIDAVLAALRAEAGQGGPFVAADALSANAASPDQAAALSAMLDLERVNLLRIAAARMPFGRPVEAARFTSGFGPRRDPINGRRGFHEGVDFAGRSGTPIRAAADGVVSFSGWMRGYGRVVKVRHAFGFETLYAHLRRARVSVGQTVARGARIGDMGNTGRSTGTHLHYEVRVEGKPVDPMTFIEAARNVL